MIAFNLPEASDQIAAAAGAEFSPRHHQSIVRLGAQDKVLGGVIFSNYTIASMQMSCAGFIPNWINRELLALTFDYPFVQLKCNKLVVLTKSSNHRALDLDFNLGFTHEATISGIYPDGGMEILSMRRDQCRYIGESWQKIARRAAQRSMGVKLPGRD